MFYSHVSFLVYLRELVNPIKEITLVNLTPTGLLHDSWGGTHVALLCLSATRPPARPGPPRQPARPPVSDDQLRLWILPAIWAREQTSPDTFLTELRPAVALFLQFTGLDYDNDPQAGGQLSLFIGQAQARLARYEGALLQLNIGDKGSYIYAAFGAPVAHEDDARRALNAALDLRALAADMAFIAEVRIGISRGTMRAGAYGAVTRRTYGVLGDEVNLAARLMQAAAAGEILVAGPVQAAAVHEFAWGPGVSLHVKGRDGPIRAFVLRGKEQRRAMRLQEPAYALPMVGRQAELQAIGAKLDLAAQGQGQVIGIEAEAGLGKSRLVAEVVPLAQARGFTGYGGACQSDGVNTPYLAWKPVWSAFFDVDPDAPLPEQTAALEAELARLAPERLPALPLLGILLNLAIPDNSFTRTLEPRYRQSTLHALLEDCLRAAARAAPLLIVIEAMHWIDALSRTLLEALARALSGSRVCFVLAYRPPELTHGQPHGVMRLPHATPIRLHELPPPEAERLIALKLEQTGLQGDAATLHAIRRKVLERGQGNPFFIEEILNYLRDRAKEWCDPQTVEELDWPDSLHTLILGRIDQLAEREKTTLKVASVIGRVFPVDWLHGYYPALGDRDGIKTHLEKLHRLDITSLEAPEPRLAYLFKHIVTQEVTYASLAYATRAQLHEQLAHWLESEQPAAPPLDLLAFHYSRSENRAKQREYLHKAGQAAQASFANETARDYFTRLLPLLDDPAEQMELYLERGAVLGRTGRWAESERDDRAALAIAGRIGATTARAHCQRVLGRLCGMRGDNAAALEWLEQARNTYQELDDSIGLAATQIETGRVYLQKGDLASARQELESGLALARSAGHKPGMAMALNYLGIMSRRRGENARAHTLAEESLALYEALGDREGVAHVLNNLGLVAQQQGDYPAARDWFQKVTELQHSMGNQRGIIVSLVNRGNLAIEGGEAATAQRLFAQSLALSNEIGPRISLVFSLSGLGAATAQLGDLPRAARLLAAAERQRAADNLAWEPIEERIYTRALAAVRAGLSEAEFDAAWAEGDRLSLEEAVFTGR